VESVRFKHGIISPTLKVPPKSTFSKHFVDVDTYLPTFLDNVFGWPQLTKLTNLEVL